MFTSTVSVRRALVVGGAIFLVQAIALYFFGQPSICECGYVKVWEGVVRSAGNSQHLFDWYTPSHIIHGLIFYGIFWYFFPKMSVWWRIALSIGLESAWEITENTPMVINHYGQQALAQGYIGDSILNSIMDTLAMVGGFFMAWKWPVWSVVLLGLGMELFVGYSIRDNLLLNIIGLIYPLEFINTWQSGG